MKKVLFFVLMCVMYISTACVISSCDSKKEVKRLGSYELTEQDGKLGLKDSTGHVVLSPSFDEITEQPVYKAVFAQSDGKTTIVVKGRNVLEAEIDSVVPTGNDDYVYLYCKDGVRLWLVGTSDVIGQFEGIKLIDDVMFFFENGKWGAATIEHEGLAPRQYERIFIVKNAKTRAVLVKDKSGWAMFNKNGVSDGVRYDIPSQALEKQIKPLKIADDVAVINVDWSLN